MTSCLHDLDRELGCRNACVLARVCSLCKQAVLSIVMFADRRQQVRLLSTCLSILEFHKLLINVVMLHCISFT